jgi:hypothetical protein
MTAGGEAPERYSFVTVAHGGDYPLLLLQTRSFRRYLARDLISEIIIIENPRSGEPRLRRAELRHELGDLARCTRFLRAGEIAAMPTHISGWFSQQILKLLVSRLVGTRRYVVFDAKNQLVFPLGRDFIETPSGKLRFLLMDFENHDMRPFLEQTLEYFELRPQEYLKRFPATTTPFPFVTEKVRDLLAYVEAREGLPFPEAFVHDGFKRSEFFLFCAYVLASGGALDDIYDFSRTPCATVWSKTPSEEVHKMIAWTEANAVPVFAVHRRAIPELDPPTRLVLAKFWRRRNLFNSLSAPLRLLAAFDGRPAARRSHRVAHPPWPPSRIATGKTKPQPVRFVVRVAGACVERALAARSLRSLDAQGIEAKSYEFAFGLDNAPIPYAEVTARLLREAGSSRLVVVVPAGVIALTGFRQALLAFVAKALVSSSRQRWKSRPHTRARRAIALLRPLGRSRTVTAFHAAPRDFDGCAKLLPVRPPTMVAKPAGPYPWGRVFAITEGENTYQALQALGHPERLEAELRRLDPNALDHLPRGWVYRCNNEPVRINLTAGAHCDTLVAVGSGIKPWYLAHALQPGIRRFIIFDQNLAQLRFAGEAWRALGNASSWDEIGGLVEYRSEDDRRYRAEHNLIFEEIRAGLPRWTVAPVFVHGDFVTQTFRLIALLQSLGAARPLFWYSNVFQPYFNTDWSEHHEGVEYSFVALMRRTFPGTVMFNSGEYPITDPRRSRASRLRFMQRLPFGLMDHLATARRLLAQSSQAKRR